MYNYQLESHYKITYDSTYRENINCFTSLILGLQRSTMLKIEEVEENSHSYIISAISLNVIYILIDFIDITLCTADVIHLRTGKLIKSKIEQWIK